MGIIRGGLLAIVSVLLFFAIIFGNLLLTISWSLNYENVQEELAQVVKESSSEEIGLDAELSGDFLVMQDYCESYSDYVVTYEGETIVIPCVVVAQGQGEVVDYGVNNFIERVYFAQYDCDFWDCFEQNELPFFLVSAKAQDYWYSNFNYALLVIGVFSILGFLLVEKKSNFFIILSALIVLASLPFAKLEWFSGLFGGQAEGLLSVFFSKAYSVFIMGILLGGILLIVGFALKFFKLGFKVSSIFGKAAKEEELKEAKEEIKEMKEKISKVRGKKGEGEKKDRPSEVGLKKEAKSKTKSKKPKKKK